MRVGFPPAVIIPPENQGSVLGRVVAGESSLELLVSIKRLIAITRAMEEVRGEIAALRASVLHKGSEFAPYISAPVDHEDEPLFFPGRSRVLPDRTRVDVITRPDGLYNVIPADEGRCYWSLTCDEVDRLFTEVVFDYLAERKCTKAKRYKLNDTWQWDKPSHYEVWSSEAVASLRKTFNSKPEPRTISAAELHQLRTQEHERLEQLRLNNVQTGLPTPLTNFCSGAYFTQDHICPTLEHGEPCHVQMFNYAEWNIAHTKKLIDKWQAARINSAVQTHQTAKSRKNRVVILRENIVERADKMRDLPKMADVDVHEMMDELKEERYKDAVRHLKARGRWLTEMQMEHRGGPETRSFNAILSESRLFPN